MGPSEDRRFGITGSAQQGCGHKASKVCGPLESMHAPSQEGTVTCNVTCNVTARISQFEVSCSHAHSSIFLGLGDAEVAPGEESPQEGFVMGVSREREGKGKISFSLLQTAQALAADCCIT